jgi:beta-1,4-mannosyl-glycoprotein beta-1,4-N-acetylglucosaminyltransferase
MKKIFFYFLFFIYSIFPFYLCSEVYDCFLFLDEYEVLDIRLHELADVVDKFVLVESVETFRGNAKPLNFLENQARYAKFADKIIHVVVEPFSADNPWDREFFQRNQIMRGLSQCSDKDVIMISDVDEIINHKGVASIRAALKEKRNKYVGVVHRYHSNFLNSVPEKPWRGTVATTYHYLKRYSPQILRNIKDHVRAVAQGWHFTWQGGLEHDLYKLSAYSHAETDTAEMREQKRLGAAMRHLCPTVEVDDSFPKYVQENQEYFESIGFLRTPSA